MIPANQCFSAQQLAITGIDLRLEIQLKLVFLYSDFKFILDLELFGNSLVQFFAEVVVATPPAVFGMVHGRVCIAHEFFAIGSIQWINGYTNAGAGTH